MRITIFILLGLGISPPGLANGILRWGFGARDMGAAGAFGGTDGDALTAVHVNPALLSTLQENQWTLSTRYLDGNSTFKRGGISTGLHDGEGAYPDFAASWQINDKLAIGISAGAIHSEINFNAPFIFQTNPALANAKVNLDMETDGWSPSIELGTLYRPSREWTVGGRFKLPVSLDNSGSAQVDYSAQLPSLGLAPASPVADDEAQARVQLPLTIGAGTAWRPNDLWIDWHQWSRSYDTFKVDLSRSSNADLNGAIGSTPTDRIPLDWKDRFVFALGTACELNHEWTVRGGYRYGKSPIPDNLVTPLNGATLEHAPILFQIGAVRPRSRLQSW
ncbi:MAG: long-subunit fatty acid transport protein [Akkermansiaceae bacterium]|jgi:long-subunit fatty acid transport protein